MFQSKEELKEMEYSVQSKKYKTKLNNKNGIGRNVNLLYLIFFFFLTLSKNLVSAFPENEETSKKIIFSVPIIQDGSNVALSHFNVLQSQIINPINLHGSVLMYFGYSSLNSDGKNG